MLNVAYYLDASARRCPNSVAVIHEGRNYSYQQIHRWANQIANGLAKLGFEPRDRIALCCSNRPGFIAAYYGILKIGAIVVLQPPRLKRRDIIRELRDSQARALFTFDGYGDTAFADIAIDAANQVEVCERIWIIPSDTAGQSRVNGLPSIGDLMSGQSSTFDTLGCSPTKTAAVIYTSGTSGRSKGVEITHANLTSMVTINMTLIETGAGRVRLVVTSLSHILGQVVCLNLATMNGETMVLVERFDPEQAWLLVEETGVTHLVMPPIYYRWLLEAANCAHNARVREVLRLCATGGGPLPTKWSEEFESRFGLPIVPGYGMTETTSIITWHCPSDRLKLESVGLPVPGVDARIVDRDWNPISPGNEGEIVVRSPGVMKGYLGLPEITSAVLRDGWLRTGDIGLFDEDGYLHLLGRINGMIIRGKDHIYPAEVESVLYEHPFVSQAAVIAVPDDILGQEAAAIVVLKEGCPVEHDDLMDWLSRELPEGKCPGILRLENSLPLTDSSKVARHLLS